MIAQDFRFTISEEGSDLVFTANNRDGKVFVSWKDSDSDVEYSMLNATRNINDGTWIVQEVL